MTDRETMVRLHLRGRDIDDERVVAAMASVPRELFVPERLRDEAYTDQPLPIGGGQTISQPYIVALLCQALGLRGDERVLEVGSGSGYSAAVLARLAARVYSIERDAELSAVAIGNLATVGERNVTVVHGDGTDGLAEHAPFDAIAVHAVASEPPVTLLGQLADGGRAVVPVADEPDMLMLYTRSGDGMTERAVAPVRFVPLIRD